MEQKNKDFMNKNFQAYSFFVSTLGMSNIFQKFLQNLLKKGKKKTAQSILLKTITQVEKMEPRVPAFVVFEKALSNIQPSFEFKRARVGGMYQMIPGAKEPTKQQKLAIRWILELAKQKQRKTKLLKTQNYSFEYFLANELVASYKNESELKQKKLEIHKLAESNRALAYQRWW
jgi:small subunit ribosomal protein S7